MIHSVSIHAPTRGATFRKYGQSMIPRCFNPRTHTGCDYASPSNCGSPMMFQSTHPHGVRRVNGVYVINIKKFQSTHPHGVRHGVEDAPVMAALVSIHAPTRGATRHFKVIGRSRSFNPRTHTGCDTGVCPPPSPIAVSIHAPTRGATID